MENDDENASQAFAGFGPDGLSGLTGTLFENRFRDSLAGEPPPDGYQHWGYKLVRSDRRAGGELRWPVEKTLVESELSDGAHEGPTEPGTLAIARSVASAGVTSSVGGSVLLTVAYNPDDVLGERDDGLVLVRRAYVADTDRAGFHLSSGIFTRDPRYRAFDGLDVPALKSRERASFLGPEPLEFPGLDVRRRVRDRTRSGDLLADAVALYRQPPNDAFDLALALSAVVRDKAGGDRMARVTVQASILQRALPWERQVTIQRRIDGYLMEHFGRVDPRYEDPGRPMGCAEQWLHIAVGAGQFLNLAETLIEYDIDYEDLADDDSYEFTRRRLPGPGDSGQTTGEPVLMTGPVYMTGLGADDGVPVYPKLAAVCLPPEGQPRAMLIEPDGPCAARERQILAGGTPMAVQLDARTRMLLPEQEPGGAALPVNPVATEFLGCYPEASVPGPVRGRAVIVGVTGDGTEETDAPAGVFSQLAGLGYPVEDLDDE